jgi:transcriptional regulator with XRE-family HTH domain
MSGRAQKKVELLGRKLRKLRKDRKLSPGDVASSTGIDAQDLARIERGEVDAGELARLMEDEPSSLPERERFRRELPG